MDSAVRVLRNEGSPAPVIAATEPFTLVIFGASGDLARRKLLPALHHLERDGWLPQRYAIVGVARSPMPDGAWAENIRESLASFGDGAPAAGSRLLSALHYHPGDVSDPGSFPRLLSRIEGIEREHGLPGNRLFYLAVAPDVFPSILRNLRASGLAPQDREGVWARVVVEKPFGSDLDSARLLNAEVRSELSEAQVYRIDHYLGKEAVQNLLAFRFGNAIFEPLFDRRHVESVQITVGETMGMEGKRGAYYDGAGALRDMVQNHMLQLLSLLAMEPPPALEAGALRDEKVKVLRSIESPPPQEVAAISVRGQYVSGARDGKIVPGYRQEPGVSPSSTTETFVALRLSVDNWRWAGVPFFLRTGKRLGRRVSEIAVSFREPPMHLFRTVCQESDMPPPSARTNEMVLRIQPDEGISLSFAAKRPGMRMVLDEVRMDFAYDAAFRERSPEAYERLLLDALRGDPSLFTRADEVEEAWRIVGAIRAGWDTAPPELHFYEPFGDGPAEAAHLMRRGPSRWRQLGG